MKSLMQLTVESIAAALDFDPDGIFKIDLPDKVRKQIYDVIAEIKPDSGDLIIEQLRHEKHIMSKREIHGMYGEAIGEKMEKS